MKTISNLFFLGASLALGACAADDELGPPGELVAGAGGKADRPEGLVCRDIRSDHNSPYQQWVDEWGATQPGFTYTPSFSRPVTIPYEWQARTVVVDDQAGVVVDVLGHVRANWHELIEKVLVFDRQGTLLEEIDGRYLAYFDAGTFLVNESRARWTSLSGGSYPNHDPFSDRNEVGEVVKRTGQVVASGSLPAQSYLSKAGDTIIAIGKSINSSQTGVSYFTRNSAGTSGVPDCYYSYPNWVP